jgi:hypothetical protein
MIGDSMKTVKELKRELRKFPDDALCYGYEGECTGIGIETKDGKFGFIYTKFNTKKDAKTETLNEKEK